MTSGYGLVEQVRNAQEELGTGDPAEALAMVEPLVDETREALRSLSFLKRSLSDRAAVLEAFCYARVTAVLALESQGADTALPRVRQIVSETLDVAAPGNPGWKVLCAAAEILARSGDAEGAVRAVETAAELAPEDEHYVTELRGSVRSMFPDAAEGGTA